MAKTGLFASHPLKASHWAPALFWRNGTVTIRAALTLHLCQRKQNCIPWALTNVRDMEPPTVTFKP